MKSIIFITGLYLISVSILNGCKKGEDSSTSFKEVKIGNQIWMSRNLNTEYFRNGDIIPKAKSLEEWKLARDNKSPAWCYYYNMNDQYGKLYNFYAVIDPRGLAPVGWHIPIIDEWSELISYLGGVEIAGNKLKSKNGWKHPNFNENGNGNDSSGFSAYPGGIRIDSNIINEPNSSYSEGFFNLLTEANWWTSSIFSDTTSFSVTVDWSSYVKRFPISKQFGLSVRCVKD